MDVPKTPSVICDLEIYILSSFYTLSRVKNSAMKWRVFGGVSGWRQPKTSLREAHNKRNHNIALSTMVGNSSPYFDKRRRTGQTTRTTSCYFVESPSSSWGSVKSLQSLLFRLSNATEPICRRRSRPHSSVCCSTCVSAIDGAIKHFRSCSVFQEHWRELSLSGDSDEECWKRAELHLDRSVRHLCSNRCYMRAFAPSRDWLSLRNTIRQLTDHSVGT
jgi:hypothetical protein